MRNNLNEFISSNVLTTGKLLLFIFCALLFSSLSLIKVQADGPTLASYSQIILNDSPQAYYHFDEFSGTLGGDATGHRNLVNYIGPVQHDQVGILSDDGAVGVSGSNGAYVDGPTRLSSLSGSADRTVEVWFDPIGVSQVNIFHTGTASHTNVFDIAFTDSSGPGGCGNPGGKGIYFRTFDNDIFIPEPQFNAGEYHYVAVTVSNSGRTVSIIVDGQQPDGYVWNGVCYQPSPVHQPFAMPFTINTTASDYTFGGTSWATGMTGYIDEAAIYPYALSASQLINHYQQINTTFSAPSAPTITSVKPANGSVTVSWNPPANTGGLPITLYTVTATPYANSDHFAPQAQPITIHTTDTTATITNLLVDCHQEYTITVNATNSFGIGPYSTPSEVFRPSGFTSGPPPYVEILVDGESSHIDSQTTFPDFNPLTVESYCPESLYYPPTNPSPNNFFTNYPLLQDPTYLSWSTNTYNPQYVDQYNSLNPSHHYLTDMVAAVGGVVLPYSYSGAYMQNDGTFHFNEYSSDNSANQALKADVQNLATEVSSIQSAWPGTHIIIIGHSWGGVIAEQYWKTNNYAAQGVVRVFSLDSPINGTFRASQCKDLHIENICSDLADAFSSGGNKIGMSIIREMGDRWDNLSTYDSQIIANDQNKTYIDVATHNDPAYSNVATNGKFDSFIPQLVMSSCDDSSISNQCYSNFPPSIAINCTDDNGSIWQSQGHFTVRECPDTANLINQAVTNQ